MSNIHDQSGTKISTTGRHRRGAESNLRRPSSVRIRKQSSGYFKYSNIIEENKEKEKGKGKRKGKEKDKEREKEKEKVE